MQIEIDLGLDGLESLLAQILPQGVRPTLLRLTEHGLRLEADAPMVGRVILHAQVETKPGELQLSDFDLEGAGLLKGLILARLREALAELDRGGRNWRTWGESDGERLHLSLG